MFPTKEVRFGGQRIVRCSTRLNESPNIIVTLFISSSSMLLTCGSIVDGFNSFEVENIELADGIVVSKGDGVEWERQTSSVERCLKNRFHSYKILKIQYIIQIFVQRIL